MTDKRFIVCGCTPWARRIFDETLSKLPGEWQYITDPVDLGTDQWLMAFAPDAIFFPHWRWLVDADIVKMFTCLGFHLGNLVSERGGTPVQWRILSGQKRSRLVMYRMTEELDRGAIWDEASIELSGTAEAIYASMMRSAADLISAYVAAPERCQSLPMIPAEDVFPPLPRRTPEESRLPSDWPIDDAVEEVYDRIRMVDAPGYPNAFLDYGNLRLTFRRAVLYDGRIEADVTITERKE